MGAWVVMAETAAAALASVGRSWTVSVAFSASGDGKRMGADASRFARARA